MPEIPWTKLLIGAFAGYLAYSMYTFFTIFMPPACGKGQPCIKAYLNTKPKLGLQIAISTQSSQSGSLPTIWKNDSFTVDEQIERTVNVSIPLKVRKNGTLYIYAFLYKQGSESPESDYLSYSVSKITTYSLPQTSFINLLGNKEHIEKSTSQLNSDKKENHVKPFTHWRQRVSIHVVGDAIDLSRNTMPGDIIPHLRITPNGKHYYPIVFIDELGFRLKDLLPVNESSKEMPLTISYTPISLGTLRLHLQIKESLKMLKKLGFSDKDTDEVKGIFVDTNFYLLMLTFTVAAFHMLFDFLAFKNDILYWHARKTMVGLSTKVVIWRCLSTMIIFLYLMDENTSLLVLGPTGIGMIIEIWKVTKALKIHVTWSGLIPTFQVGDSSDQEKETKLLDSQAMKYLSCILYPLCIGGAIYSLLYVQHKSWYSWSIHSLANDFLISLLSLNAYKFKRDQCVYAFGFLFMLPQLFVNYKMKSVAHLPWRAFMYKAFNTFIDDIFAFIITMPTAHRVACFRDDIVFLVYLFQRWLYPVDKKRANEFGVSLEDEMSTVKESKKTK